MTSHRVLRTGAKLLVAALVAIGIQVSFAAAAHADPAATSWAKLRQCESSGNYAAVSANGRYLGAYQFSQATWNSVGGTGAPQNASRTEQDYRALYLYRMRGWQPWTCARILGLAPDKDAKSGRKPTYSDSAYISGGSSATPKWPGTVYAYGDCAPALRTWQLRMNALGYQFQGTGCYYAKTKQAVLAVQRANGIKDSGLLGPKTWTAAWQGTAPRH